MFVPEEGRNPTNKLGMRESMGGVFIQGGGLVLILSLFEGALKLIFA